MAFDRLLNGGLRRCPTWPVYVLGVVPGAVYFYWALTNQLGADPLQMLERRLGKWALQLLFLTLLVTPLRRMTGVSLLKFRRAFGLLAFAYVCLHLATWIVLDKQFFWGEILRDLYKRPYIILGAVGFVLLVPLAATSSHRAIRRLGAPRWNRLHKLSYIVILLAATHYMMVVKAWPISPILYLIGAVLLVASRLRLTRCLGFLSGWARRRYFARQTRFRE